jgi:tetratricopeptide (TPR) repeat protein
MPMELDRNIRIDRYVNRELHPAAARAMAHEALDDSDLFEELTAVALVQAALESPATTDRGLAQSALDDENLFDTLVARGAAEAAIRAPQRRKYWPFAVAGVAAAAAGLLTFLAVRPHPQPDRQSAQPAHAAIAKPGVAPAILLTAELQPAHSRSAPVFRGVNAASRPPKSDGVIVSVEDGVATVNLGSLDGLAKGTELPVVRDRQIARIVITTVFRNRARGEILNGDAIQLNDLVRIPNATHLSAIRQQVDALAASGDLKTARDVARKALASGSPGETRQMLERLAALDFQAGAPDAARERYEVAVNIFDQPPAASSNEKATTLASYGALCLLSGDPQRADDLLQKALANATDATLRSQILHNLGAAAQRR